MIFWTCSLYNYYTRTNFKSRYLKTILWIFFEKIMHGRGPKLSTSSDVPLMSLQQIDLREFWKNIFYDFYGQNVTKMAKISDAYKQKLKSNCVMF